MRILHIGKYFPPARGGIETFLRDLMAAQARQGHDVAAIVHEHRKGRRTSWEEVQSNPSQHILRVRHHGRFLYAPISPSFRKQLRRAIKQAQPDLLHIHLPNTSAFWLLTMRHAGRVPWVVQWHADAVASNLAPNLTRAYKIYRPFEQRLLARAAAIIASTPPYLHASPALRAWQHKASTIPLGIDPERLTDPTEEATQWATEQWPVAAPSRPRQTQTRIRFPNPPRQGLRILWIGRMTYYKGIDVLLDAMRLANPAHTLCLAGDGDCYQSIKEKIDQSGLSGAVWTPGSVSDEKIRALLATCDCVCLPSIDRSEAFGMVLLEAMRFAKPVIASDIPGSGTGWVVSTAGAGLLTKPQDPQNLAETLDRLALDTDLASRFSAAGPVAIKNHFSIDQVADQVSDLYKSLI